MAGASVVAVSRGENHSTGKENQSSIRLVTGEGVDGDVHRGKTVQHVYDMRKDASVPNLRQVHLVSRELLDELRTDGFIVEPGQMGENITTSGLDVLTLPVGTRLHIGSEAVVELTGLRSPCSMLNKVQKGLMRMLQANDVRPCPRAGVMSVVLQGAEVRPGDQIRVELPTEPHQPLRPL